MEDARFGWPARLGWLALGVLALVPFVLTTAYQDDEFMLLAEGLRQLDGQVPYRDYFQFYTPLSQMLAAALFWVTGPSMAAARVMQGAFMLGAIALMARLARGLGARRWLALLPGLVLLGALYRTNPGYTHHWLVLLPVTAAFAAAARALTVGEPRWWALSGACGSLAFLVLQSDGLVTVAATGSATLLGAWLQGRRGWWRDVLAYAAGALVPLALCALWFAAHGALGALYEDVVRWPARNYKRPGTINDIPYAIDLPSTLLPVSQLPGWYGRVLYFLMLDLMMPISALAGLAWLVELALRRLRGGPQDALSARRALVAWGAIAFMALSWRSRGDSSHIAFYSPLALVFATGAAARWAEVLRAGSQAMRWAPAATLVAFALSGVLLQARFMLAEPSVWLRLESPDARLASEPLVRYVREHTSPEDRIVSIPLGGFLYFFARRPASKYIIMLPPEEGYNPESEYRELWGEIAANKPKLVVFTTIAGGGYIGTLGAILRYPLPGYHEVATFGPRVHVFGRD